MRVKERQIQGLLLFKYDDFTSTIFQKLYSLYKHIILEKLASRIGRCCCYCRGSCFVLYRRTNETQNIVLCLDIYKAMLWKYVLNFISFVQHRYYSTSTIALLLLTACSCYCLLSLLFLFYLFIYLFCFIIIFVNFYLYEIT